MEMLPEVKQGCQLHGPENKQGRNPSRMDLGFSQPFTCHFWNPGTSGFSILATAPALEGNVNSHGV